MKIFLPILFALNFNICLTFFWCVFARASRGVVHPSKALYWRISNAAAEKVAYFVSYIHGFLESDEKNTKTKGDQRSKVYSLSKYDSTWKKETAGMILPFFVGEDLENDQPVFEDLARLPHIVMSGVSGSGKSTHIRSFLECMARAASRTHLEIVAIDGKLIELHFFEKERRVKISVCDDPALFFEEVEKIETEMMRRLSMLRKAYCLNIDEYNAFGGEKLPYIVFLVEEFGRLFDNGNSMEVKKKNARMAKMLADIAEVARSTGIHMVLTTQNPSVRSIPPSVFAQMGATLSFRLKRKVDSERVFSELVCDLWAHQLEGKGAFLYVSGSQRFVGVAPKTDLKDFAFYGKMKKSRIKRMIELFLLGKPGEKIKLDILSEIFFLENDRNFKETLIAPLMKKMQAKPLKDGKKISAYLMPENLQKQS